MGATNCILKVFFAGLADRICFTCLFWYWVQWPICLQGLLMEIWFPWQILCQISHIYLTQRKVFTIWRPGSYGKSFAKCFIDIWLRDYVWKVLTIWRSGSPAKGIWEARGIWADQGASLVDVSPHLEILKENISSLNCFIKRSFAFFFALKIFI